MNYRYQFQGIATGCDLVSSSIPGYTQGMLKSINEHAVNESVGICDGFSLDLDNIANNNTQVRSKDVNNDGNSTEILNDYDQWGNLQLNFILTGSGWNNN
jgi:hypothetical protein